MLTRRKPNAVRTAREKAGLSQEKVAAAAGTSRGTVYLAERGVISPEVAAKLAPVLKVKAADLLRASNQ